MSDVVISIDMSDQEKQMAQCATIRIMNFYTNGDWLSGHLKVRNRVFIYADDGEKKAETFRGYVWQKIYKAGLTDRELTLKCYDHLIYLQESEDAEYFSPGKSSQDIISYFCGKWGVSLSYTYASITHSKLALRGVLSDIFVDDILNLVKDRTGKKYIIRSESDVMKIMTPGENSTIYRFEAKKNALTTKSDCTMDGMITKVKIISREEDGDRPPVEAIVSKNTGSYGTLQKLLIRNEDTEMDEAMDEAQRLVDENGVPKWEYVVRTGDVPWLRKGDKVYVNAGDIYQRYLIITSLERSISNKAKEMTLTLKPPQ